MPDTAQASGMRNHCGRNGSHLPASCSMLRVVVILIAREVVLHTSLYAFSPILREEEQVFRRVVGKVGKIARHWAPRYGVAGNPNRAFGTFFVIFAMAELQAKTKAQAAVWRISGRWRISGDAL
jgi:hypothetical protein